jgi:endonuclease YncB( thermonuclease family)
MRVSNVPATLAATVILAALAGEVLHVAAGPASLAVVDGDTLRRDKERYRLLGIDAAEIHRAQCDAERRLGELTKHRLEALLESGAISFFPTRRPSATNMAGCSSACSSTAKTQLAC